MKNGQIGWKTVKLDEIFGDEKMSFWKKIALISVFEQKIHHLAIFRPLKKHCSPATQS
jgi:hypothetical protein